VSPLAIWRPVAPPGFTTLGVIITPAPSRRPSPSAVRALAGALDASHSFFLA
jgi:hypothetical protein